MDPITPLRYPAHFPPTDPWKKFFIGVRGLGPDLSFFKDLHALQAARTDALMGAWGGGRRQELATYVSAVFARHMRWGSPYFLPEDSLEVILGGPRFSSIDTLGSVEAVNEIAEQLGIALPAASWNRETVLRNVVDSLTSAA